MKTTLKALVILLVAGFGAGCLNIEAVHTLRPYGDSDEGGYRISMNAFTYAALQDDDTYGQLLTKLRSFSRPATRFVDGLVYLEDGSNTASMEHFYGNHSCVPTTTEKVDCRFVLDQDFGNTPAWSIDWHVEVQPDMQIVASNHHRMRTQGGAQHLFWYFDGNRVSKANIDFTVRVPRAR